MPKYKGPYYITLKTGKDTYKVRSVQDHKEHKYAVHHNRLKKYSPEEDRQFDILTDTGTNAHNNLQKTTPANPSQTSSTNSYTTSQPMMEVDRIIKMMKKGHKKWYYVQWKDCADRTWEPPCNLPPKLLQEYHVYKTQTGKTRKKYLFKRK